MEKCGKVKTCVSPLKSRNTPQKKSCFHIDFRRSLHQLKNAKMEIIFMLNFVVCMLQILKGEASYRHIEIIIPAFIFAVLLGLWVGVQYGWGAAVLISGVAFILKFFVSAVRFFVCILAGAEIGERFYWQTFAVFALVETAVIWSLLKCN